MKKYLSLLIMFFVASCTVNYDMEMSDIAKSNQIIVNSLLNPAEPIRVHFYTSVYTDTGYVYKKASNLQVLLTENGTPLFDGVCTDTVLALDYHPKALATYKIKASLENYEEVSAETIIPDTVSCKTHIRFTNSNNDILYTLSDFSGSYEGNRSALYIISYNQHDSTLHFDNENFEFYYTYEKTIKQADEYYANNLLLDQTNREDGMEIEDDEVGSSYFYRFIRVKNKNIGLLDSLVFLTNANADHYSVKVITAGPEYDRYIRTFYKQSELYLVWDDDLSALSYQPIQVYSNVNGGLGIFAGINETNYYFDEPSDNDE